MTRNKKLSAAQLDTVEKTAKETVKIKKANIKLVAVSIEGTTPYVQLHFGAKARAILEESQRAGSVDKKKKTRSPKEFEELCEEARHVGIDGKQGMPAAAFRNACISACRLVGFQMTLSKLGLFVEADTFDRDGAAPLVHFHGEYVQDISPVRLASGVVDLRARPMWMPGWTAKPRIQFDADLFTVTDIYNLMERVGTQVGIGEGRHDSRRSTGLGWGCFKIVG